MKIQFEQVQEDEGSSLRLLHEHLLAEAYPWLYHYHPEFEVVCITEGKGTRQVGNHVSNYSNGDLVLMGPNLPHSGFGLNANGMVEQVVVQFKAEIFSPYFLSMPEMKPIKELFEKSRFGICFTGSTREQIKTIMQGLRDLPAFDRFQQLTKILHKMAHSHEFMLLNGQITLPGNIKKTHVRLQNIFNYVEKNYSEETDIEKVAGIAHLTVPAFCNYFKKIMGITFTDFINQYRIEQACIQLQQEKTIAEVSFDCGFNNISYFNKVFKKIVKRTPSEYIKQKQHSLQAAD
jgi:AraC-like DNA-binding protein